jgi:hypothetical protein
VPSFERIRDRLPSLYRPEDDDLADDRLTLSAGDVAGVETQPAVASTRTTSGRMVLVELAQPARLRGIGLARGRAPGSAYALALYPALGDAFATRPAAVLPVRGDTATAATSFAHARFLVELRQRTALTTFLLAVGESLDGGDGDAADVLQAHWFDYADRARYNAFFNRSRELKRLPPPLADDPALLQFPYLDDLGRLAALLGIVPWPRLASGREPVEAFRERVRRIVELYRSGLGTLGAIERSVEVQLPTDLTQPPERRDRSLGIEELVPLATVTLDVRVSGEQPGLVGPLMHWDVDNDGVAAASPTLYVRGVAPVEGAVAATVRPLVELSATGGDLPQVGVGYLGTLAENETLRLRPAFESWLGFANGVRRARSAPSEETVADPTAPGPWTSAGLVAESVVALVQTPDHALWAATSVAGGGLLHRNDGKSWKQAVGELAPPRCLAHDGSALLVGTDNALLRVPLHPESGTYAAHGFIGVTGPVHAIAPGPGGEWWAGTAGGLLRRRGGVFEPYVLRADAGTATAVYAIARDRAGAFYLGTELGLFEYQPGLDDWYWYAGAEATEQAPDWVRFSPDLSGAARNFPTAADVHLPPVRCVHRAADGSLWIGTDAGLARYVARPVRGLAFTTALEAFPDLLTGRVFSIAEDARGGVWFCTERGLFRADRRDMWQLQGETWAQLGRIDTLYEVSPRARGAWRFRRATATWQRYEPTGWVDYTEPPRTGAQAPVHVIAWTDRATADLLVDWDPAAGTYGSSDDVPDTLLTMRHKPSETRVVDGGIPAVPRLPAGRSTWRFLSIEDPDDVLPAARPAWTSEGRLLPEEPMPVDEATPEPGRYDLDQPHPASRFDLSVFAYLPSARVRLEWRPSRRLTVLARLRRRVPGETIDPSVLDRVWQGIEQARPAGVRAVLAVDETIVRGDE